MLFWSCLVSPNFDSYALIALFKDSSAEQEYGIKCPQGEENGTGDGSICKGLSCKVQKKEQRRDHHHGGEVRENVQAGGGGNFFFNFLFCIGV